MKPALLVVRAGDESLHSKWGASENFDLLVSYYGDTEGRYSDACAYYHVWKGPCWPGYARACASIGSALTRYRHVAFCADDVKATSQAFDRLFEVCHEACLDLASPAVTGFNMDPLAAPQAGSLLRYTNVVELLCPVFSQTALSVVRPTFEENGSGWGLSTLWASLCPRESYRTALVDEVNIEHTRPYALGNLQKVLELTPLEERRLLLEKYGLKPLAREFYGQATSRTTTG